MAMQKRFIVKNGVDNNSNSIINVSNPTNAQDVATKSYVDLALGSGSQRTTTTITPTVGQTLFTIDYTVGYIDVFYNGVKLVLADDFVATNGTSVTLTNATIAGDIIEFVVYILKALTDTYSKAEANAAILTAVPSQTGNSGKYLSTNGTATSWTTVDALPSQTGNSGKYLTTSGTAASWATLNVDPNVTSKGLYEHSKTISANYTIGIGNNASSVGPLTVASGVSITVPSGSRWLVF